MDGNIRNGSRRSFRVFPPTRITLTLPIRERLILKAHCFFRPQQTSALIDRRHRVNSPDQKVGKVERHYKNTDVGSICRAEDVDNSLWKYVGKHHDRAGGVDVLGDDSDRIYAVWESSHDRLVQLYP